MFPKIFSKKRRVVIRNLTGEKIKGKITFAHCRGHNTIIVFINFDGFRKADQRLLHLNFGWC